MLGENALIEAFVEDCAAAAAAAAAACAALRWEAEERARLFAVASSSPVESLEVGLLVLVRLGGEVVCGSVLDVN